MIDTDNKSKAGKSAGPSRKECVDTGMAMVLICLLAALCTADRRWLLAGTGLLLLNMIWPGAFSLVARLWFGFSHLLGTVMSKVVLSLIFLFFLTPLALLRRLANHDPMNTKLWKASSQSVFQTRDHTFTAEEIERPY